MMTANNRPTIPAPALAPDNRPTLRAPAYALELAALTPWGISPSLERLAREVITDGYLTGRDDVEIDVDLLFLDL